VVARPRAFAGGLLQGRILLSVLVEEGLTGASTSVPQRGPGVFRAQRPGEKIALDLGATPCLQKIALRIRCDPFGDDVDIQLARKPDSCPVMAASPGVVSSW
jgi:hypothetical protein